MSIHERTLSAIEALYDAALDETLWPLALRKLTELTGSQASSFWVLDGSEDPHLPTFIYLNFDPKAIQEYLTGMAVLDPTVRYLVAHPEQCVVHDGLLSRDRDKDTRDYYDWHERNVETRFRLVGQVRVAPKVQAGVALHRTRRAGRFVPGDVDRFGILHRHLQRALKIALQVGSLGAMQRFGMDWLDRSSAAVLLLDDRGRVIFANRSFETMHSSADGLRVSSDGITLARREDNEKLQSLIAQAISPLGSPGMAAGGVMQAERPSGLRPYTILVAPVSRQTTGVSLFRPAVRVVVTDPERQPLLKPQRLQEVFGLTRAEARLASLLSAGEDLRIAAEKLQITYGTARSRLAQIFQKTGTRRQGELVCLLLKTLVAD